MAEALPAHSIFYYGDTAFAVQSPALIRRYAAQITRELMRMGCGSIVVACNSASSNALDAIQAEAGESTPVMTWCTQWLKR